MNKEPKGVKERYMTKRYLLILLLVVGSMLMAGCAKQQEAAAVETKGTEVTRELPELTKVMLGTFKLEGTENAVTPEQASELLLLYKMQRALSESDSVAQQELDAIGEQIGDAMTTAQHEAIDALGLTMMDMFSIMEEQGIEVAGGGQVDDAEGLSGIAAGAGGRGGFAGGGPGGGQAPPDGGGMQGGGMVAPGGDDSAQGLRNGNGAMAMMVSNSPLYDALIELLSERAGS